MNFDPSIRFKRFSNRDPIVYERPKMTLSEYIFAELILKWMDLNGGKIPEKEDIINARLKAKSIADIYNNIIG